jgi:hypothetical protein
MVLNYSRNVAQDRKSPRRKFRPTLELLEDRLVPSNNKTLGDIFYIEMENHNLTQPSGLSGSPEQLLGNPAAPYLNSLMTRGDKNAKYTSYASNYYNVEFNNPQVSIHPSEPNYVWQEAGLAGPLNDADPYPNNIVNAPNLSALLQSAGIPWKSYQEDIDLIPANGSVNQPGPNSLTSTVAPQNQWTVPLTRFSGTSNAYVNPYNGSNQYNFAPKHDGQLFFTATNGGDDPTPSNSEAHYYAPLQQLQTDLDNNTVASYNLITPDQYNDMHSYLDNGFTYQGTGYTGDQAAIAEGDNFLSIVVPKIMASKAWKKNGAIVIWFDETEGGNTTDYTLPLVVISRLAQGNAYNSTLTYTHSSGLKSMEELFGVYAPGGGFLGDANTPGTNDYSDLFVPGALQPSTPKGKDQIGFSGVGSFKLADPGLPGLILSLTGINIVNNQDFKLSTTTSPDTSHSLTGLLPGTFTLTTTPFQGPQNDLTTAATTSDDIADQTLRAPGLSFQVPGYVGQFQEAYNNLALGDLSKQI